MDIGMIHIDDRPQGLGKPVLFTYNLMGVFYDTAALRGRYQMTVITRKIWKPREVSYSVRNLLRAGCEICSFSAAAERFPISAITVR